MENLSEGKSKYSTDVKGKETKLPKCKNGQTELNGNATLHQIDSGSEALERVPQMKGPRRLEPLQTERKKKRKKKRYLKLLSSRVGIPEGYHRKTEYSESGGNCSISDDKSKTDVSHSIDKNSPRDPDLSKPGERNSTTFFYCRFIVKFPVIAFCK
jgi:hypothetical protein